MPRDFASIIYTTGILGLFHLDRGKTGRMSKVLWLSAVWVFLISSHPVSGMMSRVLLPNGSMKEFRAALWPIGRQG